MMLITMRSERRRQTHLNDDLEAVHLYSGCLDPVGSWSCGGWSGEGERRESRDGSLRKVVGRPPFILRVRRTDIGRNFNFPCGSKPTKQSALVMERWSMASRCQRFPGLFRRPYYLPYLLDRTSSYRGIHMVLNILDSYPYKLTAVIFFLYLALPMSNSMLYQICPRSASHLLDTRNDLSYSICKANASTLTQNY